MFYREGNTEAWSLNMFIYQTRHRDGRSMLCLVIMKKFIVNGVENVWWEMARAACNGAKWGQNVTDFTCTFSSRE